MKCVLDRLILAAGCGDNQLKHKVGAALCTLRRSGGMETYQQLLGTINTMEMVLVTSDYWNAVHGADKGEAVQDIEGVEVIEKLGRNIAWMLKGDRQGRHRAAGEPSAHDDELYPLIRMVIR